MSEHRGFFADTVGRILADTLDKGDIDAAEERRLPAKLYDALIANGIGLLLVPEDAGGVGADQGDVGAVLRLAGDAAAPGPLLETIVGQSLLAEAGLPLADGLLSLVFVGDAVLPGEDEAQWRDAQVQDVPWSQAVEQILILGRAPDGGGRLIVTRADDWTVTPLADAAGEPRDTLRSDALAFTAATIKDYDAALRTAAIARGAQMLGAIEWAFRRSVDYAGERKQFGREISKFQAIQQMLAELAGHVLASAGITEAAAQAGQASLIAAARSRLGDAADAAIAISHQVHGALGFSLEYALNARTRRLMAWRDDFGSVLHWQYTLAANLSSLQPQTLWPTITAYSNHIHESELA